MVTPGSAAGESPAVVDQEVALSIGSHRASNYLVEKYQRQFSDGIEQSQGRHPTVAETRAWFSRFLVQQVIIAQAAALGYFDRPEIKSIVDRMECYMLTQHAGPYYTQVVVPAPLSMDRIKDLYGESLRRRDLVVVHFATGATPDEFVGEEFGRLGVTAQTERLSSWRGHEGVEVFEAHQAWPFGPVAVVADAIVRAPTGQWTRYHDDDFGDYYLLVRGISNVPSPNGVPAMPERFPDYVQHVLRDLAIRRHGAQILKTTGFVFNESSAKRILPRWSGLPPRTQSLPEPEEAALAAAPLFVFRVGQGEVPVSVETYRRTFNALFIRKLPRTLDDLRRGAEDYAIAEADLVEARAHHLDQAPKFAENRKGYTAYQVLDLYEREALGPQLQIDTPAIESYYRTHAADFARPTKARGELEVFATMEAATDWKEGHPRVGARMRQEVVELSAGQSLPGLEYLGDALLQAPIGQIMGPYRVGESSVCLLKRANLVIENPGLAEVTEAIRRRLIDERLPGYERRVAAEMARHFEVHDHIAYGRYGLVADEVAKPW